MLLNLKGKKVLVTGSSKGIGFAIAQTLHAEGCALVLNARNEERLVKSTNNLKGALMVAGDVTIPSEAKRVVDQASRFLGGLDILVCSVGGGNSVAPGSENPEEWRRIFALNLWSSTNVIESAIAALEKSKGAILCISSICGSETVPNAPVTYSAAKSALNAYVRGVARPLGRKGIRINAIAPGNIMFEGSVWDRKMKEDGEWVKLMLEQNVALNCLGSLEDVASLSAYLVSDRAKFATGGIWSLDGGQSH